MSYDISLHKNIQHIKAGYEDYDAAERADLYINSELNITFNLVHMFNWAFETEYWVDVVEGFKAKVVAIKLTDAIERLKKYKTEAEKYNAPNGWGTYPYALEFLIKFRQECYNNESYFIAVDR